MIDDYTLKLGIAYCDGVLRGYAFRAAELETEIERNARDAARMRGEFQAYSESELGRLAGCHPWGCMQARMGDSACTRTCPISVLRHSMAFLSVVGRLREQHNAVLCARDDVRAALDALVWHINRTHRVDALPPHVPGVLQAIKDWPRTLVSS